MPDVRVSNETSQILNIGFWLVAPVAFVNEVKPGQTITLHLASIVHTFEARLDHGSNRFSGEESWRKVGEIGGAVAAGTAAVLAGSAWALGAFGRRSFLGTAAYASAGAAWGAAHRGGAAYATSAEAVVTSVPGVWIPLFEVKSYSVRFENDKYVLWDDNANQLVG